MIEKKLFELRMRFFVSLRSAQNDTFSRFYGRWLWEDDLQQPPPVSLHTNRLSF